MAETKYKLDGYYVIPDISNCIIEWLHINNIDNGHVQGYGK